MILREAIDRSNRAGRLGTIFYTVPGFPNPAASDAALQLLDQSECVSIIETTIPVDSGFSEHANDVIRAAHRQASRFWPPDASVPDTIKPQLCVLYRQTVERHGFVGAISRLAGHVAGIVLEWNERSDSWRYRLACEKAGIELVQCIGPWMSAGETRDVLSLCSDQPLVYLMSADRTGGELFDGDTLARCVDSIRQHLPAAKIAAGFGVTTPSHVRSIATIQGFDAVIIGTAFLQALRRGDAPSYLASVLSELRRHA